MRIQRFRRWIKVFGFLIDGTLLLNSGRVLYFFFHTDGFDVDEDVVSILCHGECWPVGNWAGVTTRHLFDAKDRAVDTVASVKL